MARPGHLHPKRTRRSLLPSRQVRGPAPTGDIRRVGPRFLAVVKTADEAPQVGSAQRGAQQLGERFVTSACPQARDSRCGQGQPCRYQVGGLRARLEPVKRPMALRPQQKGSPAVATHPRSPRMTVKRKPPAPVARVCPAPPGRPRPGRDPLAAEWTRASSAGPPALDSHTRRYDVAASRRIDATPSATELPGLSRTSRPSRTSVRYARTSAGGCPIWNMALEQFADLAEIHPTDRNTSGTRGRCAPRRSNIRRVSWLRQLDDRYALDPNLVRMSRRNSST